MEGTNHKTTQETTDVEKEIMKMTGVVSEIRMVLENILRARDIDRRISETVRKGFMDELNATIDSFRKFSSSHLHGLKTHYSEIVEEEEEE